jgi:Icc-related predicted phosphoesterase
MKLLVGSDYHGSPLLQAEALAQVPTVDGYINCGDFCTHAGGGYTVGTPQYLAGEAETLVLAEFLRQLDQLGKPWLFVPGNHDPDLAILQELNQEFKQGAIATVSELVWLLGLRLLVVPWTPPCGWNWTLTHKHLAELVAQYKSTTIDLLVTHAPPKGILDEESKWYHRRTPTLRPLVDVLNPPYYFCGHMHYDGGKQALQGQTIFVNAALHNLIVDIDR